MCIELISAVKHLKGSEVAPRGLFQGFLQNRKSKKTIQDPQSSEDVILSTPSLPSPPKSEMKKTDYTAHLTRLEESSGTLNSESKFSQSLIDTTRPAHGGAAFWNRALSWHHVGLPRGLVTRPSYVSDSPRTEAGTWFGWRPLPGPGSPQSPGCGRAADLWMTVSPEHLVLPGQPNTPLSAISLLLLAYTGGILWTRHCSPALKAASKD